ncbi:carbonic anhydrase [Kineococcus gypseus]|uniref:carbonic anhydrase n=1 Tax=Kineococcus gypseus TaxID=1637102 RepID=UPI003D7F027B
MSRGGTVLPASTGTSTTGGQAPEGAASTTRRGALRWAAAVGGGALGVGTSLGAGSAQAAGALHPRPEQVSDPQQALELLRAGNARFAAHPQQHHGTTRARREALAEGQHPFAAVLSCADSRVPPELVFDQDLGDLFTVRTAGQVIAAPVLGSVQYGVEHLHTPLVVVLGHERCGAVKATLEAIASGAGPSGTAVDSLIEAIRPPALAAIEALGAGAPAEALLAEAVRRNVLAQVAALAADPVLAHAQAGGHLRVVGATYDLHEGTVTFL